MELNLEGLAELGWRSTRTVRKWEELTKSEQAALEAQWASVSPDQKLFYKWFADGVVQAYRAAISI